MVTAYGDVTPGNRHPGPQDSGADPALYQATKQVIASASQFVAKRELDTWPPETHAFLKSLKNESPFDMQGTVLMAVFKKGESHRPLQTIKFAYTTRQNTKLPYEHTFDLPHEEDPAPHPQDYVWGDLPSQSDQKDLVDVPVALPDPHGRYSADLHSAAMAGRVVEFGAWVKDPKSPVDFLPIMWYLAEHKGIDTLATPMEVNGKTVNVYPSVYRAWCDNDMISYYEKFGFHFVRKLGPQIALIEATRDSLRDSIGKFIENRLAKSPELGRVTFHFGLEKELAGMGSDRRMASLKEMLFGVACPGFFDSLTSGGT